MEYRVGGIGLGGWSTGGTVVCWGGDSKGQASPPKSADDIERKPVRTTFDFSNESDSEVTLVTTSECVGMPPWLTITEQDGSPVATRDVREHCSCSQLEEEGTCETPDSECGPVETRTLRSGSGVTLGWLGRTHKEETIDGTTCRRGEIPDWGETFEAEFCWTQGSVADVETARSQETCETFQFKYGEDLRVEKIVE
jgi:hypothetical protein